MQESALQTNLDILFQRVKRYRASAYYRDLLNVCRRFRNLAPYNAMLVNMQKPGSRYVLREDEWRKRFSRIIKPNAQPLIVLVPFGPVDFLFEIGDTQPDGTQLFPKKDTEIMDEIAAPYRTKSSVSLSLIHTLMENSAFEGVAFDEHMNAGVDYAAKIEILEKGQQSVEVRINQDNKIPYLAPYLISINAKAESGELFANIVHELGHLFCYHLDSPAKWEKWKVRDLPHEVEEFEAESVSWLICERLNVGNPSEKYLAGYLDGNSEIPNGVSIERIFSAFNKVWNLLNSERQVTYRDGWIYKKDKAFQQQVKQITSKRK